MDVYAPLPTGAALPSGAAPTLFSPNQVATAGVLGGPLAGLCLVGLNHRAQGRDRDATLAAALAVVVMLALVGFGSFLPVAVVNGGTIGLAFALRNTAKADLAKLTALGGTPRPRSWWAVLGLATAGALSALLANGLYQSFAPDFLLRQVTLETGDIVEYRGGASAEEARGVGSFLVAAGQLSGEGAIVRVERLGQEYGFGLFLEPSDLDPATTEAFRGIAYEIGVQALGGAPVRLRSCDALLDRCRDWP